MSNCRIRALPMMKSRPIWSFLFLICVSSSFAASMASAAEWQYVAEGGNATVEIDASSLRRDGDKVKVWSRWTYSPRREVPGEYLKYADRSVELSIYKCAARMVQSLQITYHDAAGTVVSSRSYTERAADYSEIAPDSIGEAILNVACSKTKPAARRG